MADTMAADTMATTTTADGRIWAVARIWVADTMAVADMVEAIVAAAVMGADIITEPPR
jgi:hypothetical protein